MNNELTPTMDDLTTCWCGYQAAGISALFSHQRYCDTHDNAPMIIGDQRNRIAELRMRLKQADEMITMQKSLADEFAVKAQAEITEWKRLLAAEMESNQCNVESAELRIAELNKDMSGFERDLRETTNLLTAAQAEVSNKDLQIAELQENSRKHIKELQLQCGRHKLKIFDQNKIIAKARSLVGDWSHELELEQSDVRKHALIYCTDVLRKAISGADEQEEDAANANGVIGSRVRIVGMNLEDKREGTVLRRDASGRNLIVHLDGDKYARLYPPSSVEYKRD